MVWNRSKTPRSIPTLCLSHADLARQDVYHGLLLHDLPLFRCHLQYLVQYVSVQNFKSTLWYAENDPWVLTQTEIDSVRVVLATPRAECCFIHNKRAQKMLFPQWYWSLIIANSFVNMLLVALSSNMNPCCYSDLAPIFCALVAFGKLVQ